MSERDAPADTDPELERVLRALALELPGPVWDDATKRIRERLRAQVEAAYDEGFRKGFEHGTDD